MVFPRNRLRYHFCLIALSSLLLLTSPARGADPVDSDEDGMADSYETDHGLNPADPGDKDDDPDADGSTNHDEFIAGTDPQDPDDFPAIPPLILELPATLYSDQISALVIKTSAQAAGGSVFLSLYFDANDNGLIDVGERPVFFEAVRDGYTGLTKTFARDSNPEASVIITTIGGASESCVFSAFPVGSYILRAQYSGLPLYTDRVFSVEAVPTTGTIAGRVEEEGASGAGIADALVYFATDSESGQFQIFGLAFTDAEGNYRLEVTEQLPLTGYLAAIRDGGDFLRNDSGETFTLAPDSVAVPLLTLSRGDTSLTGAVTDYEALRPIFGLELNADSPPLRGKAFTDGEGNYRLPLASGRDWSIDWGGFVPGYFAFVEKRSGEFFLEYDLATPAVPAPEVMDLWGFPETAWANVQVVDEHGMPVKNAQFTLISAEVDPVLWYLQSPGITNADGQVRLGAREGMWELRSCYTCTSPLVDDQPVLLVPGTTQEPTLSRGTTLDLTSRAYRADAIIEGYVVYADGSPAGGVVVDLWSGNVYNNNVRIAEWPNIQVETDENGFFRVPVLGGLWDITAYNDWGYSETVIVPAPVDYDEIIEAGEVTRLGAPLFIPPDYCFDGKKNNGEVGDGGPCDTAPAVAVFTQDVTLEGSGTGTVTDDRGALSCFDGVCGGSYPEGTVVTLTAVAGEGSTFSGWGGACAGTAPACTVTMNTASSAMAEFRLKTISGSVLINNDEVATQNNIVTLTISASGDSSISDMRISKDNVSWFAWEPFTTTKNVSLTDTDGDKTIYLQFRDATGFESVVYSDTIILASPPTGYVIINSGALTTNTNVVNLFLSATDNDGPVAEMQLSKDNISWYDWVPFESNRTISLITGPGDKPIYVRYRDASGNTSPVYTDSIYLDDKPPTGSVVINGGAATTTSESVILTLSATDAEGPVTEMQFSRDDVTWYAWKPYATTDTINLLPGDGPKTIFVRFKDAAGNVTRVWDYITLAKPPTGYVIINSGATSTNSNVVNIFFSATDNDGAVPYMQFSKDNITWYAWTAFASNKSISFATDSGTKYIYARYKDAKGNISPVYSDSIYLDVTPPAGSVKINNGAATTDSLTVTLNLLATDVEGPVTEYQFSKDDVYWYAWWPYATSTSLTLLAPAPGTSKAYIYVHFKDAAGNIKRVWDTIDYVTDTTPPTGSVVINNGDATTLTSTVNLTISAADNVGVTKMRLSKDNVYWYAWKDYATTDSLTLLLGLGSRQVYIQFQDAAGNISQAVQDDIEVISP